MSSWETIMGDDDDFGEIGAELDLVAGMGTAEIVGGDDDDDEWGAEEDLLNALSIGAARRGKHKKAQALKRPPSPVNFTALRLRLSPVNFTEFPRFLVPTTADPDVLIVMPRGFRWRAQREVHLIAAQPGIEQLRAARGGRGFVAERSLHFSVRAGSRRQKILSGMVHPLGLRAMPRGRGLAPLLEQRSRVARCQRSSAVSPSPRTR